MNIKNFDSIKFLEKKIWSNHCRIFLWATREADEISKSDFTKKVKISRANLCDIEKGRKLLIQERTVKLAKLLKLPEITLVKLNLQDALRQAVRG